MTHATSTVTSAARHVVAQAGQPVRVLVVDDSALMRKVISSLLDADPGVSVVGTAGDAHAARAAIKSLNPDVITLDVEMPGMNGIAFLSNLMRLRPMPVVMVSSLTEKGAEVTMQALQLGAADFVTKPKYDARHGLEASGAELLAKVKSAARVPIDHLAARYLRNRRTTSTKVSRTTANSTTAIGELKATTDKVIAIGASTGGTEAVREVLLNMPPDAPGIVVTIHIPPIFSRTYAERMDRECSLSVCEAADAQEIRRGHVYVAPGDKHLEVVRDGAHYRCRLSDGPPVNRHKPAVDVLFDSVAQSCRKNAICLIMTGMGKDGAKGLSNMKEQGAATIAQDEASSVVWGMPRAAVETGDVDNVLSLQDIAPRIRQLIESI